MGSAGGAIPPLSQACVLQLLAKDNYNIWDQIMGHAFIHAYWHNTFTTPTWYTMETQLLPKYLLDVPCPMQAEEAHVTPTFAVMPCERNRRAENECDVPKDGGDLGRQRQHQWQPEGRHRSSSELRSSAIKEFVIQRGNPSSQDFVELCR